MFSFSGSGSTSKSKSSKKHDTDDNFVMYFWQAHNGIRSGFIVSKEEYLKEDEDQNIQSGIIGFFLPASHDQSPQGLSYKNSTQNLRLVPVKDTYVKPYLNVGDMGFVFCRLFNKDGTIFEHCPRHLLERAIAELKRYDLELKVGFEVEFQIYNENQKTGEIKPVENNSFAHIDSTIQFAGLLTNIVRTLQNKNLGIKVDGIHKESASGQFEVIMGYDEVMKSIDKYHLTRQVIKTTLQNSQQYNQKDVIQKACFLPKTIDEQLGNGLHAHMSIWRWNQNILGDKKGRYGLSPEGEAFMAGILHHYDALLHFLSPTPNSLRRLIPDFCSGVYKIWGIENREAPIRLIDPDKPADSVSHFEVKSLDHTANTYVAIAAIIVAGVEGLKHKMKLPEPFVGDPYNLSEKERKYQGIETLPLTFEERKKALYSESGKPFREFFGEDLINNIFALQAEDYSYLAGKTLEEEVKILFDKF